MPSIRSLCIFATTALAAFSTVSTAATPRHAGNDLTIAAAASPKREARNVSIRSPGSSLSIILADIDTTSDDTFVYVSATVSDLLGSRDGSLKRSDDALPPPDTVKRVITIIGDLRRNLPPVGPLLAGMPIIGPLLVDTPETGADGPLGELLGKLKSPTNGQLAVTSLSDVLHTATAKLEDVSKQLDVLTADKGVLPVDTLSPILQALTVILLGLVESLSGVTGENQAAAFGGLGVQELALLVFGVIQSVIVILGTVINAAGPSGAAGVLNVITNLIGPLIGLLLALVVQPVPGVANIISGLLPTICDAIPATVFSVVPGVCIGN